MGGNIRGRLEALEARVPGEALPPVRPSDARRRMTEHLVRLAALRRGELSEEEAAEVRAANAAIEERLAARRGGA